MSHQNFSGNQPDQLQTGATSSGADATPQACSFHSYESHVLESPRLISLNTCPLSLSVN